VKHVRAWTIVLSALLLVWALPCWGQGENPPAAQAGKTSGHGMTAVEQGTPSGSTEDQIRTLTKEYTDALVKGDTSTLDRLLADDYVSLSAATGQKNKQQYLDGIRSGDVKWDAVNLSDQQIHIYGDDTAVSTATVNLKGRSKTKGDISGTYQAMRVWVKRNGRWQTVSFQSTPVSGTQSAATPR
jgi:ketosteroid isomerase-like protein